MFESETEKLMEATFKQEERVDLKLRLLINTIDSSALTERRNLFGKMYDFLSL